MPAKALAERFGVSTRAIHYTVKSETDAKIAGHHAWVGKYSGGRRISGAVARRLREHPCTGLNFNPTPVA